MLKPYHVNWLQKHPDRSEEWLETVLSNGFDIHHLDGDHSNNEWENLILVEHSDHMRILHKAEPLRVARPGVIPAFECLKLWNERFMSKGEMAYKMRSKTTMGWAEIVEALGLESKKLSKEAICGRVLNLAKSYARSHALKWPCDLCDDRVWDDSTKSLVTNPNPALF